MRQLQCEQAGAGWDVGGGSRELYMISSASSPAHGGGGGETSQRGSLALSLFSGERHPAPCKQRGAVLRLPERSDPDPEPCACWEEGLGETGLSPGRHDPIWPQGLSRDCLPTAQRQVMEIKQC